MKKDCREYQCAEMLDVLKLRQDAAQLQAQNCFQLAEVFETLASQKLCSAMYMQESEMRTPAELLREAACMFEADVLQRYAYAHCLPEQQKDAILSQRIKAYGKLVDLLHECECQEHTGGYRCMRCGYEGSELEESCALCHAHQGYFYKQG